jgi:integrase
LIVANPVEPLPLPKVEREEMRFLTADEVRHLADTIDPRYRAFVLVAGYGGFRLGELLALRWKRVDLLRRQITITETLTDLAGRISFGPPKTRAAVRTVGLPAFVEEAGLTPLRMHDLRHTAISLWIAAGANPKQIAVRAGHTSVSVVLDRYGHLFPQHEDALQALEYPPSSAASK